MKWVQTIMKFTSKKTKQSKRIRLIKKFALDVLVPAGKDVSNNYFQKIIKKNKRTRTLFRFNNHIKKQLIKKGQFSKIQTLHTLFNKQYSRLI